MSCESHHTIGITTDYCTLGKNHIGEHMGKHFNWPSTAEKGLREALQEFVFSLNGAYQGNVSVAAHHAARNDREGFRDATGRYEAIGWIKEHLEKLLAADSPRTAPEVPNSRFICGERSIDCQKENFILGYKAGQDAPRTAAGKLHEPKMYTIEGPITGHGGTYTVANLGCTCGWNSDGEAYKKEGDWTAHLAAPQPAGQTWQCEQCACVNSVAKDTICQNCKCEPAGQTPRGEP